MRQKADWTGGIVGGGWAGMGSMTLTELAKGRFQFRAPRKYGGYFRRQQEHRDFVSIGTAAGAARTVILQFGPFIKCSVGCTDLRSSIAVQPFAKRIFPW